MINTIELASIGFLQDGEEAESLNLSYLIQEASDQCDSKQIVFDVATQMAYLEEYSPDAETTQLIELGDRWDLELLVRLITILKISTGNSPL